MPVIIPTSSANIEIIIFSKKISVLNCPLLAPIIFSIANCLLLFFKKLPTEYKISTKEKSMDIILAINNIMPIVLPESTIFNDCTITDRRIKFILLFSSYSADTHCFFNGRIVFTYIIDCSCNFKKEKDNRPSKKGGTG